MRSALLSCGLLHAQQRLEVLLRVEAIEIIETLADAEELHGHRKFRLDTKNYAGAGAAIHLRYRQPAEADRLLEHLNLLRRVLPDVRVKHCQHLLRRMSVKALQDATNLAQLFHEIAAGVQAAGGID